MSAKMVAKRRGHPPSPLESRLLIRFAPSEFARYSDIARALGVSLSGWVRQACHRAARGIGDLRASGPSAPSEFRTMRTQIRLRPSEIAAWTQLAEETGLKLSEWIRQACYLAAGG